MGYVYKLTFSSGKSYIGLTSRTVMQRIDQHRMDSKSPKRSFAVHHAWNKYGDPTVEILCEASGDELAEAERRAIVEHGTISPRGYNLSIGGDMPLFSDETRERMSKARIGRKFGDEHKQRISEALKGRKFSEEHRANLSVSQQKRLERHDLSQFWTGRKQSPEHVAKRIEATMRAKALKKERT